METNIPMSHLKHRHLLSHPRIPLPQSVYACRMPSIMYDVVACVSIGDDCLTLPTASGEFELGGKVQLEVDGGDAVAGERHLDTFRLPVAQRVLVAGDVDGVREVLAAQFDVNGAGLLADIAHQILGTENDLVVQGCCQAGHEAVVMTVAGKGLYGGDGVFGEV